MRPQLLCTFTYIDQLPISIGAIHKNYNNDVANMKCYVYLHDTSNVICVYNVFTTERRMRNTITINHKKQTNTLYSINALNAIIRDLNNGVLDKNYMLDWEAYQNSIVLSEGIDSYKVISIKELSN